MEPTDVGGVDNLRGWLTTVGSRVPGPATQRHAGRIAGRAHGRSSQRSVIGTRARDHAMLPTLSVWRCCRIEKLEPPERLAICSAMCLDDLRNRACRGSPGPATGLPPPRRRVQGQALTSDAWTFGRSAECRPWPSRTAISRRLAVSIGDCASRCGGAPNIVRLCAGGGGRAQAATFSKPGVQSGGPGEWQHRRRVAPSGRAPAFRDRLHGCGRKGR